MSVPYAFSRDYSTPSRPEFSSGWSPAKPGQARTKHETLTVLYREAGSEVIYALDGERNRYFIDKDTKVDFERTSVMEGQVIEAFVNDEGYVLRGHLSQD
ncbi:hypothetical protein [Variovorax sp. Sphag1AA]|uniref:hypothetical protein n=1 Tax=Variovorax sp. Sphag1AA TaxID=2587027 RepID=UPI00160E262C|nr:hypothetical protein [Variovorax sp. Sphag1AA]MBB3181809.1 hypothetical protein [Variovorax sp. Sphag1AA]